MSSATPQVPAVAPAQALGFSLQYTRLTALLLQAGVGTYCSLEVLDDVAQQSVDGETRLVQTKSSLGDNPVSDRAIPFWKTLCNWLKLIERGDIDPKKTVFEIYVSRQVGGDIVDSFHAANSTEKARSALDSARTRLWGTPPTQEIRRRLPAGLARFVDPVLSAPEELVIPMIVGFRLECASTSPSADLQGLLTNAPISPNRVHDVRDKLCGWVKHQVDSRLEKAVPAVISRDDFHREYTAYVTRIDRDTILRSFAPRFSEDEKDAEMSRDFVQQLEMIELGYEDKLGAISDYLRACYDRTYWSKTGEVHEESFIDLDDALHRTWRNVKQEKLLEHRDRAPVEQGQFVYTGCMQHRTQVQGMVPPDHFIPGCFHRLADDMSIGWHPDYRNALARKRTGGQP
ncbi:MAG TPA: ABC-three component system protein [bacterium]|nr:ABC-three component system protein [bacterium]